MFVILDQSDKGGGGNCDTDWYKEKLIKSTYPTERTEMIDSSKICAEQSNTKQEKQTTNPEKRRTKAWIIT